MTSRAWRAERKREEMWRRQRGKESKAGPATMASRALVGRSGTGEGSRRRWWGKIV